MLLFILKILGYAASAVGFLKSVGVGVTPGPAQTLENAVLNIINETEIDHTNYENGQAVIAGTFSENNTKGYIVFIKEGGPAYKNLFGR